MKTLYLSETSANIVVDKDTDFVGTTKGIDRYAFRNIYYIEEPMHVVYQAGEHVEEIDVKKGEFLLVFYNHNAFGCPILATAKSAAWAKQVKAQRDADQKAKEEWAKKQQDKAEAPCVGCDACGE